MNSLGKGLSGMDESLKEDCRGSHSGVKVDKPNLTALQTTVLDRCLYITTESLIEEESWSKLQEQPSVLQGSHQRRYYRWPSFSEIRISSPLHKCARERRGFRNDGVAQQRMFAFAKALGIDSDSHWPALQLSYDM